MIGDRLSTDILFGNLNGMFTILTRKVINEQKDDRLNNLMRNLKYKILDKLLLKHGFKPID